MTRDELQKVLIERYELWGTALDAAMDAVDAYVAAERERLAQLVEELPGPDGVGLAKWPEQDRAIYLLAIEEAAAAIRAGGAE